MKEFLVKLKDSTRTFIVEGENIEPFSVVEEKVGVLSYTRTPFIKVGENLFDRRSVEFIINLKGGQR